jgi:hypothetical protein
MNFSSILALFAKLFGLYQSTATGGAATAVAKITPAVETAEAVGTILTTK